MLVKIYKLQYAVYAKEKSVESQKKWQTNSNLSETKGGNLGELLYEIILEYQSHKGIMYPNYISFNNSFESLQPPLFYPIDVDINNTNRIRLTFNRNPLLKYAMKKRNYRLWYNHIKLKIDSIEVKKNIVLLYLKKEIVIDSKQSQLSSKFVHENLMIEFKNIYDIYGNELNKHGYVSYNQYRVFCSRNQNKR